MICHPNAKINLGLNITARRPDGYHDLETIFYPIPVCDTLQVETLADTPAAIFPDGCVPHMSTISDCTLFTAGIAIDCPPEKNLLVKTVQLLKQDFDLPHIYIYMYKQIPFGAGLGGGSADAAFMAIILNRMFALGLSDEELEHRVSAIGADCAFFVRNRPVFATGIGNIFTPINLSLSGWYLVLIKPDIFVSTKEAYAKIRPRHPKESVTAIVQRPVETWRDTLVNDFEKGIFALHPEIATIKDKLYECGASYASMSGSGSSVFGLFRYEPNEAEIQELFRKCFCQQHKL